MVIAVIISVIANVFVALALHSLFMSWFMKKFADIETNMLKSLSDYVNDTLHIFSESFKSLEREDE